MKIIIGLGNPGLRYRNTRHNIGFKVIDLIARENRFAVRKKGYDGIYGVGRIAGKEAILFKPQTFMNLSGKAVKAVCSSRLEEKEDLLVVCDDFSLPFGSIRLREKGTSGGHNGLQSIIEHIGPDFARLKVGIKQENRIDDLSSYVLSSFSRRERGDLGRILEGAAECAKMWLDKGLREAANCYNK